MEARIVALVTNIPGPVAASRLAALDAHFPDLCHVAIVGQERAVCESVLALFDRERRGAASFPYALYRASR
jgi:hypothetical protein